MQRTIISAAISLVIYVTTTVGLATPASAEECQASQDIRDAVSKGVEQVLSVNTSIGPSMSSQEAIASVLQMTLRFAKLQDQERIATALRSALTGGDEDIKQVIKACFPAWSKLMEASDASPLKRQLRDAYNWWRYASLCNQVRDGYVVQFVNDDQLRRARSTVKAIEAKVTASDPSIDKDKMWNEVSANTRLTVMPVMCGNALRRLLNANPGGAYTIERP